MIPGSPKMRRRGVRLASKANSSKIGSKSSSSSSSSKIKRNMSIPASVLTSSSDDSSIPLTLMGAALVTPTAAASTTSSTSSSFFDKFSSGRRKRTDEKTEEPRRLGILRSPFDVTSSIVNINNSSPITADSSYDFPPARKTFRVISPPPSIVECSSSTADDGNHSSIFEDERLLMGDNSPIVKLRPSLRNDSPASTLSNPSNASSPEKMVHTPTARGQFVQYSAAVASKSDLVVPQLSPVADLRYSLQQGRKGMSPDMKRRSKEAQRKVRIKDDSNRILFQNSVLNNEQAGGMLPEEMNIKIFVLLIQPDEKMFELTQLLYPPSITTVGDILHMIPTNATEPILGSQQYTGLIRPRRRAKELVDLDALACDEGGANISQGEILVAIPVAFKARRIVSLSKQILANPRIQKLLTKSDPLGCAGNSKKGSKTSSFAKPPQLPNQTPMSVVEEEDDDMETVDTDSSLQLGLERATKEAAVANAQTLPPRPPPMRRPSTGSVGGGSDVFMAASSAPHQESLAHSTNNSVHTPVLADVMSGNYQDMDDDKSSLQGSINSWSKSFDSSVMRRSIHSARSMSSNRPHLSIPVVPLRQRSQQRAAATLVKCMAVAVLYLMVRFIYNAWYDNDDAPPIELNKKEPMGVFGLVQCAAVMMALVRLQMRTRQREH